MIAIRDPYLYLPDGSTQLITENIQPNTHIHTPNMHTQTHTNTANDLDNTKNELQ